MISIKVRHFESKHRCLVEKNVIVTIFCPKDWSTFLRVLIKRPNIVYGTYETAIGQSADKCLTWFANKPAMFIKLHIIFSIFWNDIGSFTYKTWWSVIIEKIAQTSKIKIQITWEYWVLIKRPNIVYGTYETAIGQSADKCLTWFANKPAMFIKLHIIFSIFWNDIGSFTYKTWWSVIIEKIAQTSKIKFK